MLNTSINKVKQNVNYGVPLRQSRQRNGHQTTAKFKENGLYHSPTNILNLRVSTNLAYMIISLWLVFVYITAGFVLVNAQVCFVYGCFQAHF